MIATRDPYFWDHTESMVLQRQLPHAEQMNPDGVR